MARVKWKNQQTGEKAQFIAETLNEALFNYSFDSNKAPTLNTHFFCEDYLATYAMVNEGIMQVGDSLSLDWVDGEANDNKTAKVTLSEMINVGLCVYDTLSIFRMIVIYLMVLFITTLLFLPQIVKSINNEAKVEE